MLKLDQIISISWPFIDGSGELIAKKHLIEKISQNVDSLDSFSGEEVYLYNEDCISFIAAFLACLVKKVKPVILPNIKAMPQDGENRFFRENINWTENRLNGRSRKQSLEISEDSEFFFYTSGSTGEPKKVRKTFKNLIDEVEVLEESFALPTWKDCVVVSSASHLHIYGFLFKVLWPLLKGRTIQSENCYYHENLLKYCNKKKVVFISSPAFLKRLDSGLTAPGMLLCVFSSGGELLKIHSDKTLKCLNVRPIEILGSTETGGVAFRLQGVRNKYWTPFSQVDVSLGENSRLHIKSPFIDKGEFLMGDRGKIRKNGQFELHGRTDRIVKIEEKRISLPEIEKYLLLCEYVLDCAVVALEKNGRQFTGAIVSLNDVGLVWAKEKTALELNRHFRNYLSQKFDRVVLPRSFRFVDEVPTNTQGKRNTAELKEMFE